MKRKILFMLLSILSAGFPEAYAITKILNVGNRGANEFTIRLGDTVQWNLVEGSHEFKSITGPNGYAPWSVVLDSNHSVTFRYVPAIAGEYTFGCTNPWHQWYHGHSTMMVKPVSECSGNRFDVDVSMNINPSLLCGDLAAINVTTNLPNSRFFWRQDTTHLYNPNMYFNVGSTDSSSVVFTPSSTFNIANVMLTVSNPAVSCVRNFYLQYIQTVSGISFVNIKRTNNLTYEFTLDNQSASSEECIFAWDYGDGSKDTVTVPIATSFPYPPPVVQTHTYTIPGNYKVLVAKKNNTYSNCVKEVWQMLNGVSIVNTTTAPTFDVYPLPANNFVTLKTNGLKMPASLSVFDFSGKAILPSMSIDKGLVEINTSSLAPGIYFIKIDNSTGSQMAKFQVLH